MTIQTQVNNIKAYAAEICGIFAATEERSWEDAIAVTLDIEPAEVRRTLASKTFDSPVKAIYALANGVAAAAAWRLGYVRDLDLSRDVDLSKLTSDQQFHVWAEAEAGLLAAPSDAS